MTALKKYKAYTLVEMLVVMGIFGIIAGMGFATFYGLRDTMALNQELITFSQDVRNAQRSALFLDRTVGERWIYGVGVDFSQMNSDERYNTFKWCSQFNDFGDTKTKGTIPNFDKTIPVGSQNGNLPTANYLYKECSLGISVSELVKLTGTVDKYFESNFNISFPSSNNATGDVGGVPVYLVFESVSGRAFFYDSSGNIVNYTSAGLPVDAPVDLVIEVRSPRTRVLKVMTVSNISGKVTVENSTY
ncbi:type II secretion system GspH family protein [Candidatus Dojkabacteria bacterium]|jgi:prepilin-type N-terminal cleavage/methylation domain-containing protein|nr:type II secretion system GspH family protein [Candidatus Dojkabacteria bacterium]